MDAQDSERVILLATPKALLESDPAFSCHFDSTVKAPTRWTRCHLEMGGINSKDASTGRSVLARSPGSSVPGRSIADDGHRSVNLKAHHFCFSDFPSSFTAMYTPERMGMKRGDVPWKHGHTQICVSTEAAHWLAAPSQHFQGLPFLHLPTLTPAPFAPPAFLTTPSPDDITTT